MFPAPSQGNEHKNKVYQNNNFHIGSNSFVHLGDTFSSDSSPRRAYEQFLDTLHFPEIHSRQEGIHDAHSDTYEWVFHPPDNEKVSWNSLVEWLEAAGTTPPYWIQGKPGSGKSTLVNFIVAHQVTTISLCKWADPSEPIVFHHFFWEAGALLQKDTVGMLRSLLWQLFNYDKDGGFSTWQKLFSQDRHVAWTKKRLITSLREALYLLKRPVCMFLDGLDECSNIPDLIRLIEEFQKSDKIKLCLSSRPERKLYLKFHQNPGLCLHDLTLPDMRRYIEDEVSQAWDSKVVKAHKHLINMLLGKAQGVFLWVRLVLRSLMDGLENGDDSVMMLQRLDEMPDDLSDLYSHMLSRQTKQDQERYTAFAAMCFSLVARSNLSLLELTLALDEQILDRYLHSHSLWKSGSKGIDFDCEKVAVWILSRCANFLEISSTASAQRDADKQHPVTGLENPPCLELVRLSSYRKVTFVHRSAKDFLETTIQGQQIITACELTDDDKIRRIYRAKLVNAIVSCYNQPRMPFPLLEPAMIDIPDTEAFFPLLEETQLVVNELLRRDQLTSEAMTEENIPWESFPHFAYGKKLYSEHHLDWLGYFAYGGKYHFVMEVVETGSKSWNTRMLTDLLSLGLFGFHDRFLWRDPTSMKSGILQFSESLLSKGADPNLPVRWSEHRPLLSQNLDETVFSYFLFRGSLLEVTSDGLSLLVDIFLGFGADPNAQRPMSFLDCYFGPGNDSAWARRFLYCAILVTEWSALDLATNFLPPISLLLKRNPVAAKLHEYGAISRKRIWLIYEPYDGWYLVSNHDSEKFFDMLQKFPASNGLLPDSPNQAISKSHLPRELRLFIQEIMKDVVPLKRLSDAINHLGITELNADARHIADVWDNAIEPMLTWYKESLYRESWRRLCNCDIQSYLMEAHSTCNECDLHQQYERRIAMLNQG